MNDPSALGVGGHQADLHVLRLEDALSKMRRKYDLAVADRMEAEEKVEELRADMGKLRMNHAAQAETKTQLNKNALETERMNKRLTRRVDKLVEERSQLKAAMEDTQKEYETLKKVVESREASIKNLRNKIMVLESRCSTAMSANDARDADIRLLMDQFVEEKNSWVAEVAMLREYIEKDQKMREHLYNRNVRVAAEAEMSSSVGVLTGSLGPKSSVKEQLELRKWKQGVKDIAHMNTIDRALERIKTIMCVDDLDEAVAKFVAAEETQDHFLNAINELHARKSEVEASNVALRDQLQAIQNVDYMGKSTDHKRTKVLETKLYQAESSLERLSQDHSALKKLFSQVMQGISDLCSKAGAIGKGDEYLYKQGISDSNVMTYLGLVEERILDLIHHPSVARAQQQVFVQSMAGHSPNAVQVPALQSSLSAAGQSLLPPLPHDTPYDAAAAAAAAASRSRANSASKPGLALFDSPNFAMFESDDSLSDIEKSLDITNLAHNESTGPGSLRASIAVTPLSRSELKRKADLELRSLSRSQGIPSSHSNSSASRPRRRPRKSSVASRRSAGSDSNLANSWLSQGSSR